MPQNINLFNRTGLVGVAFNMISPSHHQLSLNKFIIKGLGVAYSTTSLSSDSLTGQGMISGLVYSGPSTPCRNRVEIA